ncbi:Tudor and KH domain-containing protein-like protein [Dinothrombium tinctorium]|uniref:Tudor and KH domain-containing protein-like protein n=3 Tax=Dinothrombium tinctorium TaxID=1965070 RepID=A0A3S3NVL0_9ACAR|nr:Tudor and KH domain-containing protein-like protein [Dinothrombium tinctorium]
MEKLVKQVITGIGIAVGVTASCIALYLLMREEKDESEIWNDVRTTRQTFVKVKVPKDSIGAVIGRGGEMIKDIQEKTNTKVKFEDLCDSEMARNAVIRGTPEDVIEAEALIRKIILNQASVDQIFIPFEAIGFVIGKNGESIRNITEGSGAKVTIGRNTGKGPRAVTIKGSSQQIAIAKSLIDERLQMSELRNQRSRLDTTVQDLEKALGVDRNSITDTSV